MQYFKNSTLDQFYNIILKELHLNEGKEESTIKKDIIEYDNEFRLIMQVPGYSKEDLNISIKNNYIIISGSRKKEGTGIRYIQEEIDYNSFENKFEIKDSSIELSLIKSKLVNGELIIDIPKKEKPKESDFKVVID